MSVTIVSEPIGNYLELYSDSESEVLRHLSMETHAKVPGAHMLTGHYAGLFLSMISKIVKPNLILEVGTYTGYSAICLAAGLSQVGKLITIDNDDRWQNIRDDYWAKAGLADKIEQVIGNGVEVLKSIKISPDLVFIDADKKNYWNYLQLVIPMMNSGGIILVDNVLFHGEVVMPEDRLEGAAAHIHEFNKQTLEDNRIQKIMIPIRDGISMFRVK